MYQMIYPSEPNSERFKLFLCHVFTLFSALLYICLVWVMQIPEINGFLSFFLSISARTQVSSFLPNFDVIMTKRTCPYKLFWTWRNRVSRVFWEFYSCGFSSSFTEFLEFKFLQLELLPLRVVTAAKVWLFYKITVNKSDCKRNDGCCTLAQSEVRLVQKLSLPPLSILHHSY